jgi:hypothetical protein
MGLKNQISIFENFIFLFLGVVRGYFRGKIYYFLFKKNRNRFEIINIF